MARLRKPSPYEPTFALPSSVARATRSSPRKVATNPRYISSSDDEGDDDNDDEDEDEPRILIPKSSRRILQQKYRPVQEDGIPHLSSQTETASDALAPRKQRILRPVQSNSRLLKKPSAERLAKTERRERRVRSGTTDTNVGKRSGLLYAKSLAKSVVKKQAEKQRSNYAQKLDTGNGRLEESQGNDGQEQLQDGNRGVVIEEEHETSILCGEEKEEDAVPEFALVAQTVPETSGEDDEDEGPVVTRKHSRRQPPARRVIYESSGDETDDQEDEGDEQEDKPEYQEDETECQEDETEYQEDETEYQEDETEYQEDEIKDQEDEAQDQERVVQQKVDQPTLTVPLLPKETNAVVRPPQELTSMRPPRRKGKSTISNWAQGVVDLTSSPEPPTSLMAPPPARYRTESFTASSRPTSSMSSGALVILA